MQRKRILLVGPDAYLADGLAETCRECAEVVPVPRWENRPDDLSGFSHVVNFTVQGEFSARELADEELIDARIAEEMRDGCSGVFVMLSSRRVYGRHDSPVLLSEDSPLDPQDPYAVNKVRAESLVRTILPSRSLVLRVANVLAKPVKRTGYRTFMGWISESLAKDGVLTVTENPDTRKDFISREYLHSAMSALFAGDARGTVNIGGGFALPIAEWLRALVPEGRIRFVENPPTPHDQFILDVKRLSRFVAPFTPEDLLAACAQIRKTLEG